MNLTVSREWTPRAHPAWEDAVPQWKWSWPLHIFGFGSLHLLLFLFNIFSVFSLRRRLLVHPVLLWTLVFSSFLSASQGLVLLVDPYEIRGVLPVLMVRLIGALAYPMMATMFSLLQLHIMRTTRLSRQRRKHQCKRNCVLAMSLVLYFVGVIVITVLSAIYSQLKHLVAINNAVFVTWGVGACVTFIYGCFRLRQYYSKMDSLLTQIQEYAKAHKASRSHGGGGSHLLALYRIQKPSMKDDVATVGGLTQQNLSDSSESAHSFFNEAFLDFDKETEENVKFYKPILPGDDDEMGHSAEKFNTETPLNPGLFQDGRLKFLSSIESESDSVEDNVPHKSSSTSGISTEDSHPVCTSKPVKKPRGNKAVRPRKNRQLYAGKPRTSTEHLLQPSSSESQLKSCSAEQIDADPDLRESESGVLANGYCHMNPAFSGSEQSLLRPATLPGNPATVPQHTNKHRRPRTKYKKIPETPEPAGDSSDPEGGYLADAERNSPKLKEKSNHSKGDKRRVSQKSDDDDDVDDDKSPTHKPYSLPFAEGHLGMRRVRQAFIIKKASQVACCALVFMIVAVCLQIYAMFGGNGVFASTLLVPPWPWFIFQTFCR